MHIISFYVVIIRIHFRFVEIAACLYNKIILDKINQLISWYIPWHGNDVNLYEISSYEAAELALKQMHIDNVYIQETSLSIQDLIS